MNANTDSILILYTDILAKEAALLHEITTIDYTSDEALLLVENWVWNNWKTYWSTNKDCKYQEIFNLPVSYNHIHGTRKKDTIISRIRLQHTKLNAGLFKIGLHPNGLCDTCNKVHNGYHFIMECRNTKDLNNKLNEKIPNKENFNYNYILMNPSLMDIVADFVIEKKITL